MTSTRAVWCCGWLVGLQGWWHLAVSAGLVAACWGGSSQAALQCLSSSGGVCKGSQRWLDKGGAQAASGSIAGLTVFRRDLVEADELAAGVSGKSPKVKHQLWSQLRFGATE